jgi:DNA uptake protein ComE-like DNA-binding protein
MRRILLLALVPLAACESGDDAQLEAPDVVVETEDLVQEPAESRLDVRPVNLNTATAEELATIPGVGERMAGEFEEYRPYVSIAEFRREIGKYVDAETVAGYEPYVYVPVLPNVSDAETIAQLPGVGPAEAQALVDGRPYDSADAFLDRYAEVASSADRDAAAAYLAE